MDVHSENALLNLINESNILYIEMPDGFRFTLSPTRAMWLNKIGQAFPSSLAFIWTGPERAALAIEAYRKYKACIGGSHG